MQLETCQKLELIIRCYCEQFFMLFPKYNKYNICTPVIKYRRLRWAGHVARMEEGRSAFKILTGKRHLGKPRHRWEDNIRMDLEEIGINAGNWVDSAQ